jgi:serine/threonine-protein kinase
MTGARFARFAVHSRIGVGGMGEVFRARCPEVGEIALKLMRPEIASDEHHRRMFLAEAEVGALLAHPNLVRQIDYGETNRILWLAMECVDGVALDRLVKPLPLSAEVAAYVILELLAGLSHVHDQGLVHRDVSAANVLVSTKGEVKLSDFGVAKVRGGVSLTRTNEEKGKPSYMAPEQLRGLGTLARPVDWRIDLFAAGVLLHRMTQGRGPFNDVSEWLREGCPLAASGPLAPVITRAMAREPSERYATAAAMAQAVREHQPVSARAVGQLVARVTQCLEAEPPISPLDRLIIASVTAGQMDQMEPVPASGTAPWGLPAGVGADGTDPIDLPRGVVPAVASGIEIDSTAPLGLPRGAVIDESRRTDPVAPPFVFRDAAADFTEPTTVSQDSRATDPLAPAFVFVDENAANASTQPTRVAFDQSRPGPVERMALPDDALVTTPRLPVLSLPAPAWKRFSAPGAVVFAALVLSLTWWRLPAASEPVAEPATPVVASSPPLPPPRAPVLPEPAAPRGLAAPVPIARAGVRAQPPREQPSPARRIRRAPQESGPTGYLTLDTQPWGTVYLDGRRVGVTPFARVAVPAGHHRLSIDLEDSGRRRPLAVLVAAAQETRLSLQLK